MSFKIGHDSKAISLLAHYAFGGFLEMFRHFGWPERGSRMMISAHMHLRNEYGSIEDALDYYREELPPAEFAALFQE